MKKWLPFLLLALGLLIVANGLIVRPTVSDEINWTRFGAIAVKEQGRVKPLDTAARNALLSLRGKSRVLLPDGTRMTATEWWARTALTPSEAQSLAIFRIDHPQVVALVGGEDPEQKYFSYTELQPTLSEVQAQARMINEREDQPRDPYESAVMKLFEQVFFYQQWMSTLRPNVPGDSVVGWLKELEESFVGEGAAPSGPMMMASARLRAMEGVSILAVPAPDADQDAGWFTVGASLQQTVAGSPLDAVAVDYGRLADALKAGDANTFNSVVEDLAQRVEDRSNTSLTRLHFEYYLNRSQPFILAMTLYVLIFLIALVSWLVWPESLGRAALWLLVLAFALHTFGLLARMYVHARPPVTNLYSSAIFVGWAASGLGILLERWFRNGIGSASAAVCGFLSLLVAYHLGTTGETMEVMRAVLDSNFWLTTHVITITLGYSATFLAGFLAIVYVVRGMLTRSLTPTDERSLRRMVYGIIAFGLLFSFIGTVLGGIWADQSWGRFWGWDPKENGALMIVLWNAMILHALRAHVCANRGLMLLAISGNIVTSWSWFGTNMLGVGLHSYGFMDSAFMWLMLFWASQALIIIIALAIPLRHWRSPAVRQAENLMKPA